MNKIANVEFVKSNNLKRVLKNKSAHICANTYGDLFISVYTGDKHEGTYKFDGNDIGNVDLEVGIPTGKRKEYSKIIKLK